MSAVRVPVAAVVVAAGIPASSPELACTCMTHRAEVAVEDGHDQCNKVEVVRAEDLEVVKKDND